MKIGTQNFQKERLQEAREARGLTQTYLAEMAGVSKQQISLYEKGKNTPSLDVLNKLLNILNFPEHFFFNKNLGNSQIRAPIFYRSISAATKTARVRAEWKLSWLREITKFINYYLELPKVNLPTLDLPDDPLKITNDGIERYAQQCRSFWGLGAGYISDITLLLEKNGVIVARSDLGADTLDALSEWGIDGRPYVYLSSSKESAARSRFDIAHELAHLVLHRNIDSKQLSKPDFFKAIEKQAHHFASAFLLPADTFCSQFNVPSLEAFLYIKRQSNISMAAMIKRCQELEIIDEFQAKSMFINYSRRGWRKGEPLDDQIVPERPRLLKKSIQLLIEKNILTKHDIKANLPYGSSDICELAGLELNYLDIEGCVITDFPSVKVKQPNQENNKNNVISIFKKD